MTTQQQLEIGASVVLAIGCIVFVAALLAESDVPGAMLLWLVILVGIGWAEWRLIQHIRMRRW